MGHISSIKQSSSTGSFSGDTFPFIIPFALYIFLGPIFDYVGIPQDISYAVKIITVALLLLYYWKAYRLSLKFSWTSVIIGILIFNIWVGLEGLYPMLAESESFFSYSASLLTVRFFGSVFVAPVIEELFTRSFINRYIIAKDWYAQPLSKFTRTSFWFTVLFFGFSHNRWLPGVITGIALNLLLMKKKRIEDCIAAHMVANLALGIFVLLTGQFKFW